MFDPISLFSSEIYCFIYTWLISTKTDREMFSVFGSSCAIFIIRVDFTILSKSILKLRLIVLQVHNLVQILRNFPAFQTGS